MTKSLGEPERVAEERKSCVSTLDTLKKAIKVLQRDPDITNTAFGEDELEEQLRIESMQRKRDEDAKRAGNSGMAGGQPQSRPPPQGGMPPGGMPPGGMPNGGGVRPGMPGGPMGGPPNGMQPRPPGPGGQGPLNAGGAPNTGNLFGSAPGGGPLGGQGGKPQ